MIKLFTATTTPPPPPPPSATVTQQTDGRTTSQAEVCLARREHQSFQVALRPRSTMNAVRLIAKASVPAVAVTVALVIQVNVSVAINAANRTGLFPDALPAQPAKGATLPAGITTAWWVTVTSALSGNFSISLELEEPHTDSTKLGTVAIAVLDFAIPPPNSSSFMSDAGIDFSPFFLWAKTPVAQRPAVIKGIYAQLAQYRINRLVSCDGVVTTGVSAAPSLLRGGIDISRTGLATAGMDEMIALVLRHGFTAFALPNIKGCGPVLRKPHVALPTDTWMINGTAYPIFKKNTAAAAPAAQLSAPFVAAFKSVYGAMYAHLVSKGWAQHARAIFLDEPSGGFTTSAVNAVNALWSEVGLRVMQTEYETALRNVTSWNIKADSYTPALIAAQRTKGGNESEVLVYSNAQAIIDLPAIRSRSLLWMIQRSNANGTGFQGWGSETGYCEWHELKYGIR